MFMKLFIYLKLANSWQQLAVPAPQALGGVAEEQEDPRVLRGRAEERPEPRGGAGRRRA